MKLLIYPPVERERFDKIVEGGCGMSIVNAKDEAAAEKAVVDAEAFFGKMTPRILAAAGKLEWVQTTTASLEHYLFPELVEHPSILTNMRGLFSDVIADHVFGYMVSFARNFHRYIRNQEASRWEPVGSGPEFPPQQSAVTTDPGMTDTVDQSHFHLGEATLGIVGLGRIGSEIARRGALFGMRVLAVDPAAGRSLEGLEAVWKPDRLPELLGESDFVVIAAPHTPETDKLFRLEQFQQMKRSAYLINIGRGVIVDLADLTAALRTGEIAGAGLDVFEVEPLPADHPLWKMENVIVTPHVAGRSPRIAERHLEVLLENIHRFVNQESLKNVADKSAWF